jgi:hypothetical protein
LILYNQPNTIPIVIFVNNIIESDSLDYYSDTSDDETISLISDDSLDYYSDTSDEFIENI